VSLRGVVILAFAAQGWILSLALWLHTLCSWLADDKQNLVQGLSEQKKVIGRDK